jgi:hypothetical protein
MPKPPATPAGAASDAVPWEPAATVKPPEKRGRGRPPKDRTGDDVICAALRRASPAVIARCARVDLNTVGMWRQIGAPTNGDGTWDWFAFADWAKGEGKSVLKRMRSATAAPAPEEGASSTPGTAPPDYVAMDERYKALARKQKFDIAAGLLIEKAEAEKESLRMALTLRASLLALPDQLATQLADLPAIEAANVLRERLVWLCNQFRMGRVPLTPEVEAGIDAIVAAYVAPLPPIDDGDVIPKAAAEPVEDE